MTGPKRVALIPTHMPDVPQELIDQASALARAVWAHPSLSVTIAFHAPEPTTPKNPLFVAGDARAAARAMLAMGAGLCDMFEVPVTSVTVDAELGAPITVRMRMGEVRHD